MKANFIHPPYGYDAPAVLKRFGIYSIIALLATLILMLFLPTGWSSLIAISLLGLIFISLLFPVIAILAGSLYFKFRERDWLFSHLPLKGSEQVLDVGCGRGLLLIKAAKQLTTGRVYGLDLWIQADQSRNSKQATLANAKSECVDDKVEIYNGDMQEMPFSDASMDVIISSWAIHNISDQIGRIKALSEILRVLKPGGRIAILDIEHAPFYQDYFVKNGLQEVQLLGPKYTFGNKTYLVLAKK